MHFSSSTPTAPHSDGLAHACAPGVTRPGASPATQQRDGLCGPFCLARVLAEEGRTTWNGEPIDQDLLAARAGTTLSREPDGCPVPPGATHDVAYRFPLATAAPEASGTTAEALAAVAEEVSGGALRSVALRGPWTAESVVALVAACGETPGTHLIANLQTGLLWGSRPDPDLARAELMGVPCDGPPPDWDVGHFVQLRLLLRGPGGPLVWVHDSYPTLGIGGSHLQPPRALAGALERTDGRAGGILAVGAPTAIERLGAAAAAAGVVEGFWDNGTRS